VPFLEALPRVVMEVLLCRGYSWASPADLVRRLFVVNFSRIAAWLNYAWEIPEGSVSIRSQMPHV
jgi:hypothetical protein